MTTRKKPRSLQRSRTSLSPSLHPIRVRVRVRVSVSGSRNDRIPRWLVGVSPFPTKPMFAVRRKVRSCRVRVRAMVRSCRVRVRARASATG